MAAKRFATEERRKVPALSPATHNAGDQPPSVGTLIEQLLARVHGLEVESEHLSIRLSEMEAAHFEEATRPEAEAAPSRPRRSASTSQPARAGVAAATVPSEQAVVRTQYACIRERNWEALASIYHPLVHYCDPDVDVTGREKVLERARQLEAPFSDAKLDVSFVPAGDGFVVAEWVYSAANHGALSLPDGIDLPATGRPITLPGISVFQVESDLVVAERSYWDNAALYSQLGVLPPVGLLGSW